MNMVYETIKSMAAYLILITVLLNLVNGKSYRKYVELVCGMVLIVIVLTPVTKILNLEDDFLYHFNFSSFKVEALDTEPFWEAEETSKKKIEEEYKEVLTERIDTVAEQNGREVKWTEIVLAKEDYGEIEQLTIEVGEIGVKKEEEKEETAIKPIEKIQIDTIDILEENKWEDENIGEIKEKNKITEAIRKTLAAEFAMNEERIFVYEEGIK